MRFMVGATLLALAAGQAGPQLFLNSCSAAAARFQQWTLSPNGTKLWLTASASSGPMCMDIEGFQTTPGATVYTWPCGDGSGANELWTVSASSIKSQQTPPTCLVVQAGAPSEIYNGTRISTANCSGADAMQTLAFSAATGLIVHTPSGLCVDGGSPLPAFDFCTVLDHATWPICDAAADIGARAADIVSRLSLADKIAALGTDTPFLGSVDMAPYQWWSEATHGISVSSLCDVQPLVRQWRPQADAESSPCAPPPPSLSAQGPGVQHNSQYPGGSNTALPITTSCSFNRSLWKATGNQIAREGRAYMNAGLSASTFWTPVINIVRDPRWGRNIESAGEDPFVSGQYAANFIQGFEHAKETSYPLQASACCKHFVANELDGWNNTDRNHIDVFVPQQDLVDSYLPSFQTCVEEGKVSGIMCRCVQ